MTETQDKNQSYRIIKWWDTHSSAEQRRLRGREILCPTSFDSLGFRRLVKTPEGVRAFGVYVALAELAGRLPAAMGDHADSKLAGVLFNDQGPLQIADLADLIAMPEKVVGAALLRLSDTEINWIDKVACPAQSVHRPNLSDPKHHVNSPGDTREIHVSRARTAAAAGIKELKAAAAAEGAQGEMAALLARMGVPTHQIENISRRDGLMSAHVVAVWAQIIADTKAINKGAVIASRLQNTPVGSMPKLSAQMACRAVKDGVVWAINGEAVSCPPLGYSSDGLVVVTTAAGPREPSTQEIVVATKALQEADYE